MTTLALSAVPLILSFLNAPFEIGLARLSLAGRVRAHYVKSRLMGAVPIIFHSRRCFFDFACCVFLEFCSKHLAQALPRRKFRTVAFGQHTVPSDAQAMDTE